MKVLLNIYNFNLNVVTHLDFIHVTLDFKVRTILIIQLTLAVNEEDIVLVK